MRYWMLTLLFITGCAGTPSQPPQIQRISAEELQQLLPQPRPVLTLEDIVALSKSDTPPEAIIEKIKATGSSYELTPSQAVELARQGVALQVLDYIHAARELVVRDGWVDEVNKREQQNQQEIEALKQQLLLRPYWGYDPYWWGPYPPYWQFRPYYHYRR